MTQLVEHLTGVEGLLVQDVPESQCCGLEQDTLSSAWCWFNPGRQENRRGMIKIVRCFNPTCPLGRILFAGSVSNILSTIIYYCM